MKREQMESILAKHEVQTTDAVYAAAEELVRTALAENLVYLMRDANRYRSLRVNGTSRRDGEPIVVANMLDGEGHWSVVALHTGEEVDAFADKLMGSEV